MKTLIALLALALLVLPMLAGIGRLRRMPRRAEDAGPSPQRGPSAHNGEGMEQPGEGARLIDVPSRHESQGSLNMANQGNNDRNRQQGGGSDNNRQQQQQQSDNDRNRQQGGDRDRDRDNNRQQG